MGSTPTPIICAWCHDASDISKNGHRNGWYPSTIQNPLNGQLNLMAGVLPRMSPDNTGLPKPVEGFCSFGWVFVIVHFLPLNHVHFSSLFNKWYLPAQIHASNLNYFALKGRAWNKCSQSLDAHITGINCQNLIYIWFFFLISVWPGRKIKEV